ncbi:RlpA-like double-psi beta-barrel domain-containing protein [Bradyrhizobium sp.]|uniref:RlpA-like double-psi beta-barrel domain-containing protein n=1 Tax=Bradyrhizobium sp. TaxID=376 RepID=UPI0040377EF6
MMAFRLSAAICGVALAISLSNVAKATSETTSRFAKATTESDAVRSSAVDGAVLGPAIVGAASTYNPFKPGWREGGPNTASGERYDPSAWSAAIKTNLRNLFGGVKYRERPKFALVEAKGKKVVVKINDVGPLTPGRIIDFNERTMRHFDPSLQLGVIHGVRVTPLSGDDWTPGPVV